MQPITYMTSLFTFYLKGEIKSEQNFISFKVPNTILGLIPLGAQTEKFTISQIASTATNTRQQTDRVIDANAQQTDRIIDAINSSK